MRLQRDRVNRAANDKNMTKTKNNKKRISEVWGVEVRPSIVKDFTYGDDLFDDNLSGLHEIRARSSENAYEIKLNGVGLIMDKSK